MKLSTALNLISLLLLLSTGNVVFSWKDKRTLGQIYQDAKTGKLRSSRYAKIITPVAILLGIIGTYLAMTSR